MSRLYETMYILRPDLGEQNVDAAIAKYQTFLQDQGAEEVAIQHRGKRRLAYEIAGQREGVYIQMNYTVQPSAIEAMEKSMRLSDEVIRYMTVKIDASDPIVDLPEITPAPEPERVSVPRPAPVQVSVPVLANAAPVVPVAAAVEIDAEAADA